MYRVVDYQDLESRTFDAGDIPVTFKKGEKLELNLGRTDGKLRLAITAPNKAVYVLKQYTSEERAQKDFKKYSERLESGRYALHIIDQVTAELVRSSPKR
ncbi:MAG: hypothetical protein WCI72_02105 [archaeon]